MNKATNDNGYCALKNLAETFKKTNESIKELARQQAKIADILTGKSK